MSLNLEHTYFDRLDGAYVNFALPGSPSPKLVAFNTPLAEELGLAGMEEEITAIVSGNDVPANAHVLAMAYAGHQFGHLSPQLGDGRAALIGELIDVHGRRRDLHLKGSGRTPFSRGGDGRATLGPILREYVVAEGMHHLGVPTSRVLAAVTTGEQVLREQRLPGAVLGRIASSHLRVGTFELFALRRDSAMLERLTDYTLERHYPNRRGSESPALALLEGVADAQATLIAKWLQVGFVHGVMNTDNFTLSGETIDYGPCAFLDAYDPAAVFSSIDHNARYAFQNQPKIGAWNLARFAETLLDHIDPEPETAIRLATERIEAFQDTVDERWRAGMRTKLGLPADHTDDACIDTLLEAMHGAELDYTGTFRTLADVLRGSEPPEALRAWVEGWRATLTTLGRKDDAVAADMDTVNPVYIPRNHKVEEALTAAHEGNFSPFETLVDAVSRPFERRDIDPSYALPNPDTSLPYRTFCGT